MRIPDRNDLDRAVNQSALFGGLAMLTGQLAEADINRMNLQQAVGLRQFQQSGGRFGNSLIPFRMAAPKSGAPSLLRHGGKAALLSLPMALAFSALRKKEEEDQGVINEDEAGMLGGLLGGALLAGRQMTKPLKVIQGATSSPKWTEPAWAAKEYLRKMPNTKATAALMLAGLGLGGYAGKRLHQMLTEKEAAWRPLVGTESIQRRLEQDVIDEANIRSPKDKLELDASVARLKRFRGALNEGDPFRVLDTKRTVAMEDAGERRTKAMGVGAGAGAAAGAVAGMRGGLRSSLPMMLAGAAGGALGGFGYGNRYKNETKRVYDDLDAYLGKNAGFTQVSPFMARHLKALQKSRGRGPVRRKPAKPGADPKKSLLGRMTLQHKLLAAGGIGTALGAGAADLYDGKDTKMEINKQAEAKEAARGIDKAVARGHVAPHRVPELRAQTTRANALAARAPKPVMGDSAARAARAQASPGMAGKLDAARQRAADSSAKTRRGQEFANKFQGRQQKLDANRARKARVRASLGQVRETGNQNAAIRNRVRSGMGGLSAAESAAKAAPKVTASPKPAAPKPRFRMPKTRGGRIGAGLLAAGGALGLGNMAFGGQKTARFLIPEVSTSKKLPAHFDIPRKYDPDGSFEAFHDVRDRVRGAVKSGDPEEIAAARAQMQKVHEADARGGAIARHAGVGTLAGAVGGLGGALRRISRGGGVMNAALYPLGAIGGGFIGSRIGKWRAADAGLTTDWEDAIPGFAEKQRASMEARRAEKRAAIEARIDSLVNEKEAAYLKSVLAEGEAYLAARRSGEKVASARFSQIEESVEKTAFMGRVKSLLSGLKNIEAPDFKDMLFPLAVAGLAAQPAMALGRKAYDVAIDPFVENHRFNKMMELPGPTMNVSPTSAGNFFIPDDLSKEERDAATIRKVFNLIHQFSPEMTATPEIARAFMTQSVNADPLAVADGARNWANADASLAASRDALRTDYGKIFGNSMKSIQGMPGPEEPPSPMQVLAKEKAIRELGKDFPSVSLGQFS